MERIPTTEEWHQLIKATEEADTNEIERLYEEGRIDEKTRRVLLGDLAREIKVQTDVLVTKRMA